MSSLSSGTLARVWLLALAGLIAAAVSIGVTPTAKKGRADKSPPALPAESRACVGCHAKETPGIVVQWRGSKHAGEGVGCWECHGATAAEAGAFEHHGVTVSTVVSTACQALFV